MISLTQINCNYKLECKPQEYLYICNARVDHPILHLPTVKIIKFDNCKFKKNDNGIITIDLSTSRLDEFEIDIGLLIDQNYVYHQIVFKIVQENEMLYYHR